MPSKCSVSGCRSNYKNEDQHHVTVYTLPRMEPERTRWLDAIPTDFTGLKNPMICIKHFEERFIIRNDSYALDGKVVSFRRRIPKLKFNAVPTIFPTDPECSDKNNKKLKHRLRKKVKDSFKQENCVSSLETDDNHSFPYKIQYDKTQVTHNFHKEVNYLSNDISVTSNNCNASDKSIENNHDNDIDLMMECTDDFLSEIQQELLWKNNNKYDDLESISTIEDGQIYQNQLIDNFSENNLTEKYFFNVNSNNSEKSTLLTIPSMVSVPKKLPKTGTSFMSPLISPLSSNNILLNKTLFSNYTKTLQSPEIKSTSSNFKNNFEPPVLSLPENILIDDPNASFQLIQTPEQLAKLLLNTDIKTERKLFIPEKLLKSCSFKIMTDSESKISLKAKIINCDKNNSTSHVKAKSFVKNSSDSNEKTANYNKYNSVQDTKAINSVKNIFKSGIQDKIAQSKINSKAPSKKFQNEDLHSTNELKAIEEYYYAFKSPKSKLLEGLLKGDFVLKCFVCRDILENNINVMYHMNNHLKDEQEYSLPVNKPIQCINCRKTFNSPFVLQCHLESVHWNENSLLCRICNLEFDHFEKLSCHMKMLHIQSEMPYCCKLCQYRSSIYQDVIKHFYEIHNRTDWMLCYYCLKVFHIKFSKLGVGSTKEYYFHLQRHQLKSATRKCSKCYLIFLNVQERKQHQMKDHCSFIRKTGVFPFKSYEFKSTIEEYLTNFTSSSEKTITSIDCPNLSFLECYECGQPINSKHFRNHLKCEYCSYSTNCYKAYINHIICKHVKMKCPQDDLTSKFIPYMSNYFMTCGCGFYSFDGNLTASHLTNCKATICRVSPSETTITAEFRKNFAERNFANFRKRIKIDESSKDSESESSESTDDDDEKNSSSDFSIEVVLNSDYDETMDSN